MRGSGGWKEKREEGRFKNLVRKDGQEGKGGGGRCKRKEKDGRRLKGWKRKKLKRRKRVDNDKEK